MLAERGRPSRSLMPVISNVQWVDPDYLVFVRDGTLMAQRFDLASELLVGDSFAIADPVNYAYPTGRAMFTTSRKGVGGLPVARGCDAARLDRPSRGRGRDSAGTPGGYQSEFDSHPTGGASSSTV